MNDVEEKKKEKKIGNNVKGKRKDEGEDDKGERIKN